MFHLLLLTLEVYKYCVDDHLNKEVYIFSHFHILFSCYFLLYIIIFQFSFLFSIMVGPSEVHVSEGVNFSIGNFVTITKLVSCTNYPFPTPIIITLHIWPLKAKDNI